MIDLHCSNVDELSATNHKSADGERGKGAREDKSLAYKPGKVKLVLIHHRKTYSHCFSPCFTDDPASNIKGPFQSQALERYSR